MAIIFTDIFGMIFGVFISWQVLQKSYKKKYKEMICLSDKHLEMFLAMDKWFQNELKGKKITDYLIENKFYNITIYGMGYIGKNLYEYMKREGFEISNLVDQSNGKSVDGVRIKTLEDEQKPTDVVIVTAIYYFEELEDGLKTKFKKPVLSFADIVYKL